MQDKVEALERELSEARQQVLTLSQQLASIQQQLGDHEQRLQANRMLLQEEAGRTARLGMETGTLKGRIADIKILIDRRRRRAAFGFLVIGLSGAIAAAGYVKYGWPWGDLSVFAAIVAR